MDLYIIALVSLTLTYLWYGGRLLYPSGEPLFLGKPTMNDIRNQVIKFYSEIWNKKNFQEIEHILDQDIIFRGSIGETKHGVKGFEEYVSYIHNRLSDYHCEIEELVVDKDKAFAKMMFSGKHSGEFLGFQATYNFVSWSAAALFSFKKGKVANLWVLGDLTNLKLQLDQKNTYSDSR